MSDIKVIKANATLNGKNKKKNTKGGVKECSCSNGYGTELSDILGTIQSQRAVDSKMLSDFFWDMFVVDAFIGNWDRHNGNRGFLYDQEKYANDNWSKSQDLLALQLNTKGQGLKRYSQYFANGIYGLRFECTATATGSRNKGRLSIDDMVFGTRTGMSENQYYITNYGKTSA